MRPGVNRTAKSLDGALSRRSWLKSVGVGLTVIGLGTLGTQAMAVSSSVKAGKATDVPLKSAKAYSLKGQYIIVTQPKAGVFKAFSGICTHQGAQISNLQGSNLVCAVHGASYDTTTGAVTGGPAPSGLKKYTVTNKAGVLYITV
jgi:nitrite reductase/ring-hydroxylating ferredoxin subunit